jgi:RNA polymerase sigma factor (TIGR02999 family)
MVFTVNEVTRVLEMIQRGEEGATEQLLPLVYDELRRLAASRLASEPPGHTLQATALVHEVFVRLVDVQNAQQWNSRAHFFGAAAEAMRRILIEHARAKQRLKRGGDLVRSELKDIPVIENNIREDLLSLDDALNKLSKDEPLASQLVKLRYFVGLTSAEAADALNISPRSADRLWQFARAWLHREINGDRPLESEN